MIGSNALRVAAINSVGDFVLFLGKVNFVNLNDFREIQKNLYFQIAVVLATMLVGVALIQSKEGVQHVWVPITMASIFAYLVAHSFMTIYEV